MLSQLQPFRDALDDIMWKAMHDRVLLYGYDTYTGRFLKWYAEYYHGITVDWLVSEDMSTGRGYDREIFRPSVLDFGYRDVRNAIIWVAQPMTDDLRERLEARGYVEGETYFDFYKAIYGDDVSSENHNDRYDAFHQRKAGKRDIQFIEWLEWKYDCNFIMPIAKDNFENVDEHGARYSISTQKEIFPILDKCHVCLRGGTTSSTSAAAKAVRSSRFSTTASTMSAASSTKRRRMTSRRRTSESSASKTGSR